MVIPIKPNAESNNQQRYTRLILLTFLTCSIGMSLFLLKFLTDGLADHATNVLRTFSKPYADQNALQPLGIALDSLGSDPQWKCIRIVYRNEIFFGPDDGDCSPPSLSRKVELSFGDTKVEAHWILSDKIILFLVFTFFFQALLIGMLFSLLSRFYREKIASLEWLEDLSNKLAHDIRSPLAALKVASASLRSHPAQKSMIDACIERISNIAESVLADFRDLRSKGSSSTADNIQTSTPVVIAAIQNLVVEKITEWQLPQNAIHLTLVSNVNGIESVYCRPNELMSILSNIINNGLESASVSSAVPKIELVASYNSAAKTLELSVCDSGPGFSEKYLKNAFRKGLSSKSASDSSSGNGLGLYLAKSTLKKWAGNIILQNQESGAKVTISLKTKS